MSLRIDELAPGDRVILNCPSSRIMKKRDAVFEGVFNTLEAAMDAGEQPLHVAHRRTFEFLKGERVARFLFRRGDTTEGGIAFDIMGAFAVDRDGGLHDENGVRLFIERKMRMGQG
jgi:hypothetical protein